MNPGDQFPYLRGQGSCFGLSSGIVESGIKVLRKMQKTDPDNRDSVIQLSTITVYLNYQIAMRTPPIVLRTQLALYLWYMTNGLLDLPSLA